jgi:hypothetical protein
MIGKPEIIRIAGQINLNPHVVEKDYALGWRRLPKAGYSKAALVLRNASLRLTGSPRTSISRSRMDPISTRRS